MARLGTVHQSGAVSFKHADRNECVQFMIEQGLGSGDLKDWEGLDKMGMIRGVSDGWLAMWWEFEGAGRGPKGARRVA